MTTRRAKTRAPALPVPQSTAEASAAIEAIGRMQAEAEALAIGAKDEIAVVNGRYAQSIDPLRETIQQRIDGLRIWAEANREVLTHGGRTKTAKLSTGEMAWRARPPRVVVRAVESVLSAIRERSLGQFLRTKTEIDKEAMLADPDLARSLPGVSIASDGEDFVVTPYPAEGAAR